MLQNRYDDILREHNQEIINLSPANQTMRIELALEIKKILEQNPDAKVLEIGVGEWDATKYILQHNPGIHIDCLDISAEMIASAKQSLWEQSQRVNFIQDDAYEFLQKEKNNQYGIITSSWTIHNFPWEDKKRLFPKIYDKLIDGGALLLMDKIYTDYNVENVYLKSVQNQRYQYLPAEVREAIMAHEEQDFDAKYRMQDSQIRKVLEDSGFGYISTLDRIERDVLLTAKKQR